MACEYRIGKRPSFTLEELRSRCLQEDRLPDEIARELEGSVGGTYHGHRVMNYGVVSLFFSFPKHCSTRSHRTLRVESPWKDQTVSLALLDIDEKGRPLTLDLYPQLRR